ncbi:class I SAM-dependent methyltransferase [Aliiroseovarius sp. PTFE2010]|uniref:class I SAM-dependent methyltransferase n=1 Tax=Aliiroseovarius sp. PTFE2010 TaxID=3417190 RepID=UPI003CECC778
MTVSRLSLAIEEGLVALDPGARVVVLRPRAGYALSSIDKPDIVQTFYTDARVFEDAGLRVLGEPDGPPDGPYDAAVVCLPRVKAEARGLIEAAARVSRGGPVIVDGQKVDGIDSVLRDVKKRTSIHGVLSKAHGKIFAFEGGDFSDWADPGPLNACGFQTLTGVFSADGPDKASILLADVLPSLNGRIADLGAGWGYLSARTLERSPDVTECHLIEAEARALACARVNVTDPRARFHWGDATAATEPENLDHVIMNPPFHNTRTPDPGLGRAFIATAARLLTPRGTLWLVANRHLPYEITLAELFTDVQEVGGNTGFKVLRATRPKP